MIKLFEMLGDVIKPTFEEDYIGTVVDCEDPENLGRLRVKIPELYGNITTEHLPWAVYNSPFGGSNNCGFFMVPNKGSKVRIQLWRDHPWFPVWTGVVWHKGETPTESKISPPENYVIKTPSGNIIDLNDKEGYVRIKDSYGNYIILSQGELLIYTSSNHKLQTGGKLDITITGDCNIMSTGSVNIDATMIQLNSGVASPTSPSDVD